MTILDFSETEPTTNTNESKAGDNFTGNTAFYERLQGQRQKKGAIDRFGWVAIPVAAVAIIGVVAVTSTPSRSADDAVGAPSPVASTPAPEPVQTASNDMTPAQILPASEVRAKIEQAPAPATAQADSAAAPAPVKVARRAAAPANTDTRPAAVARPEVVPVPALIPDVPAPTAVIPAAPIVTPNPALDVTAPANAAPEALSEPAATTETAPAQ